MNWPTRILLAPLLGAFSLAAASDALTRALNTERYHSLNGCFVWSVDPTARSGAGAARYSLLHRDGEHLAAFTLGYTLYEAVVSEEGTLAGYAYSEGFGVAESGDFGVALVNADGRSQELARQP